MRIKVLVVDDSAFARKVMREVLSRVEGIEVVGYAVDGLDALEQIASLKPDVVTLDLMMPNLDGPGVLQALTTNGPRVVVVSVSGEDTELGLEALRLGAIDLVRKPTAGASGRLYDLADELVEKVRAAAAARPPRPAEHAMPVVAVPAVRRGGVDLVVIGASTGGPQAVTRVLTSLPAGFPVPVIAAVHLPAGYTDAFARRLDGACSIRVSEAEEGGRLTPGHVWVARGGKHLAIAKRRGEAVLSIRDEAPSIFVPSIDLLFASAAETLEGRVLGVILTGMGSDGTEGATLIRKAGGHVITESESSCVVYGMPRSVQEAGQSDAEAPLERIATEIVRRV